MDVLGRPIQRTQINVVDQPVPRSYLARDLHAFGLADREVIIDRIFIPNLYKSIDDASLRKPAKLGFYSLKVNKITGKRIYYADKSQMKFLDLQKGKTYDLKAGYNPAVVWGVDRVGLDEFLRWILENRPKFMVSRQLPSIYNLSTDFVCFRGVLTKLLNTPYEKREDWMLIAVKVGGTIYFHQLATEAKTEANENLPEICNQLSYAGHAFEDLITRGPDDPIGEKTCADLSAGNTGQFCCVLRSRLKQHSLVYAAEMDCIESKSRLLDPLDRLRFIEIKTTATIHSARQKDNFCRFKALKWWAQSHLSGVEKILCGYRDSDQTITRTEMMPVRRLAAERMHWSPNVCHNFLDAFLNCTKQCVTKEKVAYKIYCTPGVDITFTQTQYPIESFIPRWYLEERPPPSTVL